MENTPLVLISGTAPVRDWIKGALQDMKQADMIKSVVKWHEICYDVKRIPEYLSTAFRNAVSGRPGPVFLELPPDILNIKIEEENLPPGEEGGVYFTGRGLSRHLSKRRLNSSTAPNGLLSWEETVSAGAIATRI